MSDSSPLEELESSCLPSAKKISKMPVDSSSTDSDDEWSKPVEKSKVQHAPAPQLNDDSDSDSDVPNVPKRKGSAKWDTESSDSPAPKSRKSNKPELLSESSSDDVKSPPKSNKSSSSRNQKGNNYEKKNKNSDSDSSLDSLESTLNTQFNMQVNVPISSGSSDEEEFDSIVHTGQFKMNNVKPPPLDDSDDDEGKFAKKKMMDSTSSEEEDDDNTDQSEKVDQILGGLAKKYAKGDIITWEDTLEDIPSLTNEKIIAKLKKSNGVQQLLQKVKNQE